MYMYMYMETKNMYCAKPLRLLCDQHQYNCTDYMHAQLLGPGFCTSMTSSHHCIHWIRLPLL